jgi:hypothetical protein
MINFFIEHWSVIRGGFESIGYGFLVGLVTEIIHLTYCLIRGEPF